MQQIEHSSGPQDWPITRENILDARVIVTSLRDRESRRLGKINYP